MAISVSGTMPYRNPRVGRRRVPHPDGAVGLAGMATVLTLVILTVTVTLDNWVNKGRITKKTTKH